MRQKPKMSLLHQLLHIALMILVPAEIALTIVFYKAPGIEPLRIAGWVILGLSAVFGWLPVYTFRRKGVVPKGQSFVKTTRLVDTGIYAIVRHPQFLGGMMLGLSFVLIAQHWSVAACGVPVMIIFYLGIIDGDKEGIKKFGEDYKRYMQKVPQINLLAGIYRLVR